MREGPDPKRRRRSPVTAAIIAAVSTLIVNFALLMWMSFRTLEAMRR